MRRENLLGPPDGTLRVGEPLCGALGVETVHRPDREAAGADCFTATHKGLLASCVCLPELLARDLAQNTKLRTAIRPSFAFFARAQRAATRLNRSSAS
ncbi:MAG: hypothetical protein M0035_16885 [Actinomycetota bacterium]|jgi:hypothetical protein|nr:hypothetical protein [Actinomycetota bacterium]